MGLKLLAASTPLVLFLAIPFPPAIAQTNAPINCQAEVTQARKAREYEAYIAPFERWYSRLQSQNNPPLPIAPTADRATQILQNSNRSTDIKIITGVLEYLVGNNTFGGSNLTNYLVDRARPDDRAALVTMLDTTYQQVRNLSGGYSRLKVQGMMNLARAYRKLNLTDRALPVLFEASEYVNGVWGNPLRASLLSQIAELYIQWNQPGTAQQMLTQALRYSDAAAAEQTDPARKYTSRWVIVNAYIALSQVDRAIELLQPVTDTGMLDVLYATAAREYVSQNNFDRATQVINRIPSASAKAIAYTDLAVAYRDRNQTPLADRTFETAVTTARSITQPGDSTLESIATAYARAGGLESIERILETIPPENRGYVLMALAGEYDERNQPEKSSQAIDRLIALSSEVGDRLPSWTYTGFNQGYFRTALEIYRRTNPSADQYDSFVDVAVAQGQMEIAAEAARSLPPAESGRKNRLLQKVAVGYAQANQWEQAVAVIRDITNDGSEPYKVTTLAQLAALARSRSQNDLSDRLFADATQQASALTDVRQKVLALGAIARQLHATGRRQQAQSVVDRAIAAIGNPTDPTLYEGLLTSFTYAEQLDRAWQVARSVPPSLQSRVNLLELINASINAGRFDIAAAAAKAIPTPSQQSRAFVNIAKAQRLGQTTPPLAALALALQAAKTVPGNEQILIELPPDLDSYPRGTVEDPDDRGSLYEEIALLYAQSAQIQRGLQVAQFIQDPRNRDRIRQRVNCYNARTS